MPGAPDLFTAASVGFALGATLIIATGAQNAFVLRQGLRREHVGVIVLFCATADALLMAAGVFGLGRLLDLAPGFARPSAWRWLDAGIGVTMLGLAFWLARTLF